MPNDCPARVGVSSLRTRCFILVASRRPASSHLTFFMQISCPLSPESRSMKVRIARGPPPVIGGCATWHRFMLCGLRILQLFSTDFQRISLESISPGWLVGWLDGRSRQPVKGPKAVGSFWPLVFSMSGDRCVETTLNRYA